MNIPDYLIFMGLYIMGQFLHLCFIDIPKAKKSAKIANVQFKLKDYISEDANLWLGNIVLGLVFLIIFDELKLLNKFVNGYEKVFWAAFGALGSFAIQTRFSRFQGKIEHVIDEKTNIADSKESPEHIKPEPPLKNETE